MLGKEKFRQIDDVDLINIVESYLDSEAGEEFAELERRFWCHKIGEHAAQQGMTLNQFFQYRIGDALDDAA